MSSTLSSKRSCNFGPEIELPPTLDRREVHVLRFASASYGQWLPSLAAVLSSEERERARVLRFEEHREEAIFSRGMLRLLLGGCTGRSPAGLHFSAGPRGKPRLLGDGPHFNVAHSGGLFLFALARDAELGVDVEALAEKPLRDIDAWSCREAAVKAMGGGVFDAGAESAVRKTTVVGLFPGPGFAAALAVRGDGFTLKCWDWKPDKKNVKEGSS
jgi:hypothetical protein